MFDDVIQELIKILIKQDLKDKKEGIEYVKIPKTKLIQENIKLLKLIETFK